MNTEALGDNMLKLYKFDSTVKLNHALRKFEKKGNKIVWVKMESPREVVFTEFSVVSARTYFYVLVNEVTKDEEDEAPSNENNNE